MKTWLVHHQILELGSRKFPQQNTVPLGLVLRTEFVTNLFVQFAKLKLTLVDRCSSVNYTNEFLTGAPNCICHYPFLLVTACPLCLFARQYIPVKLKQIGTGSSLWIHDVVQWRMNWYYCQFCSILVKLVVSILDLDLVSLSEFSRFATDLRVHWKDLEILTNNISVFVNFSILVISIFEKLLFFSLIMSVCNLIFTNISLAAVLMLSVLCFSSQVTSDA